MSALPAPDKSAIPEDADATVPLAILPATQAVPTVYIVDDDPLVCAMLTTLLASQNLRTEHYPCAADFLMCFDPGRPGSLLCDVKMPGMNGLDLQRELNLRGATLPVIFVTAYADVPTAVAAMRDGAFDFLLNPFKHSDLFDKVRAALTHDFAQRKLMSNTAAARERLRTLSSREREVLSLLSRGLSNKEMAAELDLSLRTVELQRARLMSKMCVRSVAELVRVVMEIEPASVP
jgi:two-component system, LuxR family, response regulator FixJ